MTNYKKMGDVLKIDLVNNPDLALNRGTASQLLILGSISGLYTGRKLLDYYKNYEFDAFNARRVINGLDKASLIQGYYNKFLEALQLSVKIN